MPIKKFKFYRLLLANYAELFASINDCLFKDSMFSQHLLASYVDNCAKKEVQ